MSGTIKYCCDGSVGNLQCCALGVDCRVDEECTNSICTVKTNNTQNQTNQTQQNGTQQQNQTQGNGTGNGGDDNGLCGLIPFTALATLFFLNRK